MDLLLKCTMELDSLKDLMDWNCWREYMPLLSLAYQHWNVFSNLHFVVEVKLITMDLLLGITLGWLRDALWNCRSIIIMVCVLHLSIEQLSLFTNMINKYEIGWLFNESEIDNCSKGIQSSGNIEQWHTFNLSLMNGCHKRFYHDNQLPGIIVLTDKNRWTSDNACIFNP